jgi:hypothetical protein
VGVGGGVEGQNCRGDKAALDTHQRKEGEDDEERRRRRRRVVVHGREIEIDSSACVAAW